MVLIPDQTQKKVYEEEIAPHLTKGKALLFAHGFNIHFGQIMPPDGRGRAARRAEGPRPPCRAASSRTGAASPASSPSHQDATGQAKDIGLAYARAVGGGRAGIVETTFKEETETDLFGEQAVLCGGAAALVKTGFEVLVEAGYQPESAYFECLHELKLDRRPHVRGRPRLDAPLDQRHGRVRRLHPRPARGERADQGRNAQDSQGDPGRGAFAREFIGELNGGGARFEGIPPGREGASHRGGLARNSAE